MYARSLLAASALALTVLVNASPAPAGDASATYQDIEKTLGMVPGFFKVFPQSGIAGAWDEFKTLQLNPNTALDGKTKQLIGLAVAAQIPCQYCIYFHASAAKANGASQEEIAEAVAMAAMTRHWSTVLNGMEVDLASLKKDTGTDPELGAKRAQSN